MHIDNRPEAPTHRCFTCGGAYKFAFGRYTGYPLRGYDITVCHPCYSSSEDGWGPIHERKLLDHLSSIGKAPPQKIGKGFLPREF